MLLDTSDTCERKASTPWLRVTRGTKASTARRTDATPAREERASVMLLSEATTA
jgi:hypothetical protein